MNQKNLRLSTSKRLYDRVRPEGCPVWKMIRCHLWCYMVLSGLQMGAEPNTWQPFGPVFGVCWEGHWAEAASETLTIRRTFPAQGAQHKGFGKGARVGEKRRKLLGQGFTLKYSA